MVPRQKDVIPRGVVVMPQGQDIIPRRPRGGASCKDVIPRRPRGDVSLLGHNSTVAWWCLIMRIWIVKYWGLKWFGNPCVNVCYLCLTLKLHVDCDDIRFLCTSLPFRLLICCVWLSLLWWSSNFIDVSRRENPWQW